MDVILCKCELCGSLFVHGDRYKEILGDLWFVLGVEDFSPQQQQDIHREAGYCSPECVAITNTTALLGSTPSRW